MEIIQVNKDVFDRIFKETLLTLELENLREKQIFVDPEFNTKADVTQFVVTLHRRFHYEVCCLRDKLQKA